MKLKAIAGATILALVGAFLALFMYFMFFQVRPGGPNPRDSSLIFVLWMPLFGVVYLSASLLMKKLMNQKKLNEPLKFAGIFLLLGPLWGVALSAILFGFQAPCFLGGGELLDFTAWDSLNVDCSIPDPRANESCGSANYTICKYSCVPLTFDYKTYDDETGTYGGELDGRCVRQPLQWCGYPIIKERIEIRYCPT